MALEFPAAPNDGDIYGNYQWDDTAGVWKLLSEMVPALEDLTDTDISSPVSGDSLVYDGTEWVNGPRSGNAIINGDFGVWQRGTSFSGNGYTADRWIFGAGGGTATVTQETFTPADIEAIGYGDAKYFLRLDVTSGNTFLTVTQRIEDVRTLAGQEVTLSFWAKGTNPGGGALFGGTLFNYGAGGSNSVSNSTALGGFNLTASWQRFTKTFTVDSTAGKTIGDGSYFEIRLGQPGGDSSTDPWSLDLWGVQLEAGPVATPFTLAGGGSKAAELALCQRYFAKIPDQGGNLQFAATRGGTNIINFSVPLPQAIRGDSPQGSMVQGFVRGDGTLENFTPSLLGVWGNLALFQGTGLTTNPVGNQAYIVWTPDSIEVEDEL